MTVVQVMAAISLIALCVVSLFLIARRRRSETFDRAMTEKIPRRRIALPLTEANKLRDDALGKGKHSGASKKRYFGG